MSKLTYRVIKSDEQYFEYAERAEELIEAGLKSQDAINEYELLYLLISDWDKKHNFSIDLDPIQLIKSLMDDHNLNQTDMVEITGVGKSTVSEILNYKKRMSKSVIRNIASYFKIQQEVLNKKYRLGGEGHVEDVESVNPNVSRIYNISTGNLVNYDELSNKYDDRKEM
tara:strand:+ start:933 stop:1439 length:507 start_codon:yes stop_codon:yes gene_type:complete